MAKAFLKAFVVLVVLLLPIGGFAKPSGKSHVGQLRLELQEIRAKLDDSDFGLEEIKSEIRAVEMKLDDPFFGLEEIKSEIEAIKMDLEDGTERGLVPFKVLDMTGGICNTAAEGSANPEIVIDSDGTAGSFVVTSILIKTADTGVPTTGFFALSINSVKIDGILFDTRTGNLVGPTAGDGVLESADLMGTPIRRTSFSGSQDPGGNFPHQILADSVGDSDIRIRLFCRSDIKDLNVAVVEASGWKERADTITVTYIPGK